MKSAKLTARMIASDAASSGFQFTSDAQRKVEDALADHEEARLCKEHSQGETDADGTANEQTVISPEIAKKNRGTAAALRLL